MSLDQLVNLMVVLISMCGFGYLVGFYIRSSGEDRIAAGVIVFLVVAMIIASGIYAGMFEIDKIQEFWINTFLAVVVGLLLRKAYSYMHEFKHPAKFFVRSVMGIIALWVITEIIDHI